MLVYDLMASPNHMEKIHYPVLKEEVLKMLDPKPGTNAIDGTLGDGGHSGAILERISPKGMLLGIDLDPAALEFAKKRLSQFGNRFVAVQGNFSSMEEMAAANKFPAPSSIILDLGLRTEELEHSGRGFSFKRDEPLDMRFDPGSPVTAAHLVNDLSEEELESVLRSFGEEPLSGLIAREIVSERKKELITTSGRLAEIILSVYRRKLKSKKEIPWIGGLHPATRTFQALRIRTNDELEHLRAALPQAIRILRAGGRLAVISFHSLEDRIVKRFFKEQGANLKILTKRPVVPTDEEIKENPPSRSAKLRVAEKIK